MYNLYGAVSLALDLFLYLVPCLAPLGRRSVCILRQTETQPAECCNTLKPRIITQTQCCLPQIYVRCHRKCTLFLETISRSLQQRAVNRCRGSTLCLPHSFCLYVAILHASVCMLQHCMQVFVCCNTACKCLYVATLHANVCMLQYWMQVFVFQYFLSSVLIISICPFSNCDASDGSQNDRQRFSQCTHFLYT